MKSITSFDFTNLYTSLPHNDIIHSLSGVEVVGDDAAGLKGHLDALGLEDPGVQFNGHF